MDAIECIKTRRCVRSFKSESIDKSVVEDIVDCGRLAATAINIQPWAFIAITEQSVLKQVADITDHGKFIGDASCCIAVFCEQGKYYLEDGSAATQNILLAARAHGLGSCWVAGDKKDYASKIREFLGVPQNYNLISLIPMGYPESVPSPGKKPLSEVLHWDRF